MADLTLNLVKNLPSEIQNGALYLCSSDASSFIKVGKSGNVIETVYDKLGLIEEIHNWIAEQGYLTSHQSLANYSTTSEMNSAISVAVNDMATQSWVSGQGYLTEHQSLSEYVKTSAISDMATKTWVGEQGYLTSHQSLVNYSTTSEMNSAIAVATSGMATQSWVSGQGYLTSYTEIDPVFSDSPAAAIETSDINNWNDKYTIPAGGIPKSTLAAAVQTSLSLADSALQSHQSIKTVNGNTITGTGNVSVGTVTSIDLTAGTGISVSGGPITGSGSITVSLPTTVVGSTTTSSLTSVPATHRAVLVTVSASGTLSLAALPADGFEVHIIIRNSGSSVINVALPTAGSYVCTSEPTIYIAGGKYGEVNIITIGSTGYVHGVNSI